MGSALERRHMEPAAGYVFSPVPNNQIGSALSIIRCRNAGLAGFPVLTCTAHVMLENARLSIAVFSQCVHLSFG